MSETQQQPKDSVVSGSVPASETSPLLGEVTRTETLVEINKEPVTETEGPAGTAEPSTSVQVTSDSEDFRPAVDCTQTTVCVDGSGSGEHEKLDDSITTNSCCAVVGGLFDLWYTSSDCFSQSLFVLPIQLILLVLPFSAGFMGATYMDKCPVSVPTPLLMFMMGIVGTIIVFSRMAIVLARRFIPFNNCENGKSLVILGCFVILLFYFTELLCFSKATPSFISGAENFCHKTFYDFTYYANWSFLGVILCVTLLYLPHFLVLCGCYRRIESVQLS